MARFAIVIMLLIFYSANAQKHYAKTCHVQVIYSPGKAANYFIPAETIGAAFDGHTSGDINRILTSQNIQAMRSVGFGPLAYRLRTELGIEAWHWNSRGTWSAPEKQQGYWTSDDQYKGDIEISNGYKLPRRGNSHDQANDDGYSMIDDADSNTFWKSNPYLDLYFTKEPDSLHPQWVIVDLGRSFPVNALRIKWGNPFALSYKVDYAGDIGNSYFDPMQPDLWNEFSEGTVSNPDPSDKVVIVSNHHVKARFIRVMMSRSSGTTDGPSTDPRDKLGFAIREMAIGLFRDGHFHDYVKHSPDNERQSIVHTSSTDPWHRAIDLDTDYEQAGIDRFFKCGLTNNQPVLMPLGLLYDSPENAASLVRYIKARGYPVKEFEMGEEPEGQLMTPSDYGALYCEWANVIKHIDSTILLGGPGFAGLATTRIDSYSFTEQKWTQIFLTYLKGHRKLEDFNFFTFEWYPFDDVCRPTAPQLAANPQLLQSALREIKEKVLPRGTPVYISEYGYSSHSGRAEVDIEGALMYADILGKALSLGVRKPFLYGFEPTTLDDYKQCSWGNNMLFALGDNGTISYHTAAYYGVMMLIHDWAIPNDSVLEIYPGSSDRRNRRRQELVTSYALRSTADKWSILLVNKHPGRAWNLDLTVLNRSTGSSSHLKFPLHLVQYSRAQYRWMANRLNGRPGKELPPLERTITKGQDVILPPYSVTVITEN